MNINITAGQKSFCVYNICVCAVYICYLYVNTHICMSIYLKKNVCLYINYINICISKYILYVCVFVYT